MAEPMRRRASTRRVTVPVPAGVAVRREGDDLVLTREDGSTARVQLPPGARTSMLDENGKPAGLPGEGGA